MAKRVFLHIGAPKSGTTFLQDVLWKNRECLEEQGVLVPAQRVDHMHATLVVREDPNIGRRLPSAPTSWDRILAETRAFDGTVIISHEFFGAATAEQAKDAIDALAPSEVHLVLTARDYVRQIPGAWQERLKYLSTQRFAEFAADDTEGGPLTELGWRTYDISGVLGRWGSTLPPERVHVVTVPQEGASRSVLWQRFATLCGIDPESCDTATARPNSSVGVVEAELLRRVNVKIGPPIRGPRELARWPRDFLAHQVLASRGGRRFGLPRDAIPPLRERAERSVDEVSRAGYDVVGDLAELIPLEGQPDLPDPDAVTDAELLEAVAEVIPDMAQRCRTQALTADREKKQADRAERALAQARGDRSYVKASVIDLGGHRNPLMGARIAYRQAAHGVRRIRRWAARSFSLVRSTATGQGDGRGRRSTR